SAKSVLEATAYHEAGHAVVSWCLGIGLLRKGITIVPDTAKGSLGSTHLRQGVTGGLLRQTISKSSKLSAFDKSRIRAEKKAQSMLAGLIAQRRYSPGSVRYFGLDELSDRKQIDDLLTIFTSDQKEIDAWVKLLRIRTGNLLANPYVWLAVQALAAALMEQHTIPGKEATEIPPSD